MILSLLEDMMTISTDECSGKSVEEPASQRGARGFAHSGGEGDPVQFELHSVLVAPLEWSAQDLTQFE